MAINSLQLPGPLVVPQVDWSPLMRIGQAIGDYRQDQRETEAFGQYADSAMRREGAPSPMGAPQPVPHLGATMPRGIRNNNPGNIEDGTFARALPGYKGSDGRFAIFESPDHGLQAMDALLTSYGRRGLKSVNDVVSRWAPSLDGNNVGAYAQFVANGGDPNAPIDLNNPEVRRGVALRMAQFENGMPVGGAPAQGAPQPQQPGVPSPMAPRAERGIDQAQAQRLKALFAGGGKGRELAWATLMKLTGPKEPIKLSGDEQLLDPDSYRVLAEGPGKTQDVRPGGALVRNGRVIYQAPAVDRGEGVEQQVAGRRRVAEQLGQQNDPQMKIWVLTGKHPGEDRVSPTQLKMIAEAEDENTNLKGTIENLTRATELNDKIFTGYGANLRRSLGTGLPGAIVPQGFADQARATEEWQKLMEPEALQTMARTLKGATTDFELRTFIRQLADPSTTPQTRAAILKRMLTLAGRNIQVNQTRMDQIRGGSYTKPGGGQSNVVGDVPANAISELKANPSRERRMQFNQIFGDGAAERILGAGPR